MLPTQALEFTEFFGVVTKVTKIFVPYIGSPIFGFSHKNESV